MWAVIDTNVLVSALIRPAGRTGEVVQCLRDGAFTLLYTQSSPAEIPDVFTRPKIQSKYGVTDQDVGTILSLILLRGEAVIVQRHITM